MVLGECGLLNLVKLLLSFRRGFYLVKSAVIKWTISQIPSQLVVKRRLKYVCTPLSVLTESIGQCQELLWLWH